MCVPPDCQISPCERGCPAVLLHLHPTEGDMLGFSRHRHHLRYLMVKTPPFLLLSSYPHAHASGPPSALAFIGRNRAVTKVSAGYSVLYSEYLSSPNKMPGFLFFFNLQQHVQEAGDSWPFVQFFRWQD